MQRLLFHKLVTVAAAASIALCGCSTSSRPYSFLAEGQKDPATGKYVADAAPQLNDVLALKFASSVSTILRSRGTRSRITREVSATAQVALAAFAGAGSTFGYSAKTITILGMGSAGIPELQGIFDAKGRAQTYLDAVRLIEEALNEYLAHNQSPRSDLLTQNGVTLVSRVSASIHLVEKTIAGMLPTIEDMKKVTERMTPAGAVATKAGSLPANNVSASLAIAPTEPLPQLRAVRELAPDAKKPEVVTVSLLKKSGIVNKAITALPEGVPLPEKVVNAMNVFDLPALDGTTIYPRSKAGLRTMYDANKMEATAIDPLYEAMKP